jgi:UDP-N-acetylglucosamine:LPS N-acetylglucosamine transferase
MRRLLILSSNTGEGHNSVASALQASASASGLAVSVRTPAEDSGVLNWTLGNVYNLLLGRRPEWMGAYSRLVERLRPNERDFLYAPARRLIAKFLQLERPDILLSVHPMLNHFPQRFIKEEGRGIPCYTLVTDPFPPFWRGWASPWVDRYFVPTAAAQQALEALGIPASRIEQVPMPVRPQFRRFTRGERQAFRTQLGVDRPTVILINGGARGGGPLESVYLRARRAAPEAGILVVCGRNERLRRRIEAKRDRGTRTFGFVPDIERHIGAADVVVTKPGGSATFEAIACGAPLLLLGFGGLMPQESGTFHAAPRCVFGFTATNPDEAEEILSLGPERWNPLRDSQALFYRGSSGEELIERIHPHHVHA